MNETTVIIEATKSQLRTLVDNRPFRFRDTGKSDADYYLATLTSFEGLTDEEILDLESSLNIKFPKVFRAYLQHLGRGHGDLFKGSDVTPEQYTEFRHWANTLLEENGLTSFLTPKTVIFRFHQGYTFWYFEAEDVFDTPIYLYSEGNSAPEKWAESFARLLEDELVTMERVRQELDNAGGYYITINSKGDIKQTYPARNRGERPIDETDQFK